MGRLTCLAFPPSRTGSVIRAFATLFLPLLVCVRFTGYIAFPTFAPSTPLRFITDAFALCVPVFSGLYCDCYWVGPLPFVLALLD